MGDDRLKEIAIAVADEVPGFSLARRILGIAFSKPDLEATSREWLLEEVGRLYQLLQARFQELSAQDREWSLNDYEEILELTTQTVVNLDRTASQKKRRRMVNVLVNGFGETEFVEHRFFENAVATLEEDHIAILGEETDRSLTADRPSVEPRLGTLRGGLVEQLVGWQFIARTDVYGGSRYEVTALGVRFLDHLVEPGDKPGRLQQWLEMNALRARCGELGLFGSQRVGEVKGYSVDGDTKGVVSVVIDGKMKNLNLAAVNSLYKEIIGSLPSGVDDV